MDNTGKTPINAAEPLSTPAERAAFVQRLTKLFNCSYSQALDLHIVLLSIRRSGVAI